LPESLDSPPRRRASALIAPGVLLALLLLLHPVLARAPLPAGLAEVAQRINESCAWLAGTWLVVRVADLLVWERLVPWWIGVRAPSLLRQFVAVLLFAAGTAVMLRQSWELALSAVLATTGVLGIVLGLAMRGILADFFSGIALNIERSFHMGDFVVVRVRGHREPFVGTVREINWRSTRLLTPEDNLVALPNSVVASGIVENLSYPSPVSEMEIDITLDWHADAALAERVLMAAATEAWALGATAGDKPPKLRICRLDGQGVTWRIVYLLDPRRRAKGPARHTLLACVHKHLRLAGLQPALLPGQTRVEIPPDAPTAPLDHDAIDDRLRVLGAVPLLAALSGDGERRLLAEALAIRKVAAGVAVVRQGDSGDSMFVLVEGTLDVQVQGETRLPPARSNVVGPGSVFGEMAMLTGEARSATVVALSAAVLYEVGREPMAALLAARPALADALAQAATAHHARDALQQAKAAGADTPQPPRGMAQQLAARIRAWLGTAG
jgi:small-conductance mechanosensitive channel/CRP-like cAMP-binding protein